MLFLLYARCYNKIDIKEENLFKIGGNLKYRS